ncbi:MAG: prepilin-type N-terminal cleavage/methylation domain-containing protein [Planctomycetota bacterium]|nr:prepilin-type N-terminal cleavage/methylation domain-containing protein [Planctomycetota bacterium]
MNTTGRQFSSSSAPEAQPSEAGFTLVEVSVAVAVGVLCMLVLGQALSSAAGSSESIVRQAEMLNGVQRCMEDLRKELRCASADLAEISSLDGNDVLVLKTSGSFSDGLRWGACDEAGVWQAGWSARFRVVDGHLVREALDIAGRARGEPRLLVRGVAAEGDDEKGFSVEKTGSLFNVELRLLRSFRNGTELRRVFSTSVKSLPGLLGG